MCLSKACERKSEGESYAEGEGRERKRKVQRASMVRNVAGEEEGKAIVGEDDMREEGVTRGKGEVHVLLVM